MSSLIPIPSPGVPLAFGEPGRPVAVIAHDWYGRLPWLELYAQALADRANLRVLVPDLYGGVATTDVAEAGRLRDALDDDAAIALIEAAAIEGRVDGGYRVGLIGFSLGGWLGLQAAQNGVVDAAVAYYATCPPGVIPCPVQLHFAENDEFEPAEQAEAFAAQLRSQGTAVGTHTYPGTVHSFANATVPGLLNERAAALAFARAATFLQVQLAD